jgi:hypothetical protein
VVGRDPDSYAGGSAATGRASHAVQVDGDDLDKNGYPDPPGYGVVRGIQNPPPVKQPQLLRRF